MGHASAFVGRTLFSADTSEIVDRRVEVVGRILVELIDHSASYVWLAGCTSSMGCVVGVPHTGVETDLLTKTLVSRLQIPRSPRVDS